MTRHSSPGRHKNLGAEQRLGERFPAAQPIHGVVQRHGVPLTTHAADSPCEDKGTAPKISDKRRVSEQLGNREANNDEVPVDEEAWGGA